MLRDAGLAFVSRPIGDCPLPAARRPCSSRPIPFSASAPPAAVEPVESESALRKEVPSVEEERPTVEERPMEPEMPPPHHVRHRTDVFSCEPHIGRCPKRCCLA